MLRRNLPLNEGIFGPTNVPTEHLHSELAKIATHHNMSGNIKDGYKSTNFDLEGGPLRKTDYVRVSYTSKKEDDTDPFWVRKNKLQIIHYERPTNKISSFEYEIKNKKHLNKVLGDFHNYLSQEKINTDKYHAEIQKKNEEREKKRQERKNRISSMILDEPKKKRKPRKKKTETVVNDEQT